MGQLDIMMSNSDYGVGRDVDDVISQLHLILGKYQHLLRSQKVKDEVARLVDALSRVANGDCTLLHNIEHHALPTLCDVQVELMNAAEQHQRIVEESPTIAEHSEENYSMELLSANRDILNVLHILTTDQNRNKPC